MWLTEIWTRYEYMQLLPTLDNILYNVQRQGKISFYVGAQERYHTFTDIPSDDLCKPDGPAGMNHSR